MRSGARSYLMRKAEESTAPTYNMLLTLTFDYEGGATAWHCSDLPFIFGNSELLPLYDGMGEVTGKLKKEISAAICAFARTGDPNNADTPEWLPVTAEHFRTMVFDRESRCREDFDSRLCDRIIATNSAPRFGGMSAFGDEKGENTAEWMF